MSRVVCIVQARMGSRRFPGKAMRLLGGSAMEPGRPMTECVLLRAKQIKGVDEVVLTTPLFPEDQVLGGIARRLGVSHYPTDHSDLLRAFALCARYYRAGVVVRITGDCPLLDPIGSTQVLAHLLGGGFDYVSNISTITDGLDTEVMTAGALARADRESSDHYERHHVTPYIRRHPELFKQAVIVPARVPDGVKWSVDELEDLERVQMAYLRQMVALPC